MLHARIDDNRLEIFRSNGRSPEIIIASDYVQIGNEFRLELGDSIDVLVRKAVPENTESEKAVKAAQSEVKSHKQENLTNADYVVMAIRELGRPFRSVNEIMPILERNGYTSEAKNVKNAVRYYFSTDERIVKSRQGWALAEWGLELGEDQDDESQLDLYRGFDEDAADSSVDDSSDENEVYEKVENTF